MISLKNLPKSGDPVLLSRFPSSSVCVFCSFLLLLAYSFHPIAGSTWENANIKDEFKGANTRIN